MLKVSDYIGMVAGFFGILIFYLIFSGELLPDFGKREEMPVLEAVAPEEKLAQKKGLETGTAEYVILYGEQPDSERGVVLQMLDKMKKSYIAEAGIETVAEEQKEAAKAFILTTDAVSEKTWEEVLKLTREYGSQLLCTSLKEEGENGYQKEIGIFTQEAEKEIDGMIIFEGLFAQGMVYYDDLPMRVRDIRLDASCTKLIQEKNSEGREQRNLVPLLWRKQYGKGRIYVVNAPFFSEKSGIGILAGILADMEPVFAYPVVNAKAVLLDNYPEYENVDADMLLSRYSRTPVMFVRDVVWPAMDKIAHKNQLILSARTQMTAGGKEFDDMERLLSESGGEVLEGTEGSLLPIINEGHYKSDDKRFTMESQACGTGIASVRLDIGEVMNGTEKSSYEWGEYSLEAAKYIYDVYDNNDFLDAVCWSQAEERYKRYERIVPEYMISEDDMFIRAEGFVDVWYCILRTDKMPQEGDGYQAKRIGMDAWLLEITEQEVRIPLD